MVGSLFQIFCIIRSPLLSCMVCSCFHVTCDIVIHDITLLRRFKANMTQLLRSFNGGIWMNEIGCAYRFLQVIKDMRLVKRFLIRIIIVSCGLLPGQQCLSEPAAEMTLSQTDYRQLPSWEQDDHSRALLAFRLSCTEILRRDPQSDFNAGLK